jgi:anaerobic magnesium-protoporphyrin IX monomethyl ester cyclase
MIDIRQYSIFTGIKKPVASLMTSRGCPYQCSFCDVYNIMGRKLRLRSYQNVVDEIQNMVQNYGIKEIFIKDSTFTINKKWVMNFCNELLARKIDISYLCNTRVDCIDEPLIKKMKETGCRQISLGIESANEEILKNIKKNITISQVKKAFQLLNKYGIETQAFFMIGNPGETEKTVRETIDLAKELCPDYAVFSVTMLFPNTDLYKWAVAKGCIQDRYWYMHTSPSYIFVSFARGQLALKDLPIERQAKLQKKAYREYYLRPRYILHRLLQLRSIKDFQHSLRAGWSIIKG